MPARLRLLGHENMETSLSVGARIPRIRLASDPLCPHLCLGLLPATSLIGMGDGSHAKSAHLLQRKYPPEETAPPSVSPGVSPLVAVAVQGVERMEVRGQPDETQDRAPVA